MKEMLAAAILAFVIVFTIFYSADKSLENRNQTIGVE